MIKKVIFFILVSIQGMLYASVFDFSQDRPLTTDIPPNLGQFYHRHRNPARACGRDCKPNNWARCNAQNLKVCNEYLQENCKKFNH